LTEAEATLSATSEQKASDEDIFESTRSQCKAKSDDWDERGRLRTEQLTGINKALEILTSDEARDTFIAATGNRVIENFGAEGTDVDFLQVDQIKDPRQKAFLVLKNAIKGTNNLRLARIAALIRRGHFDDVIANIEKMLAELKQEGLDDVIQRDWCIGEQHFNEDLKSRKEYDISQIQAKIERAEQAHAAMEKKKERTQEQIQELVEMMEQAELDRAAESKSYSEDKADDETAIQLLTDAIAALAEYGKNNFLQKKSKKTKQPVFEVDEDEAPDATFSSGENHAGGQDAVITMMTQIKENLENEVALAIKSEEKALVDHETLKEETAKQDDQYDKYIIELDNMMAQTTKDIKDLEDAKTSTEEERQTTVDYLLEIKPNCEWIKGAFMLRKAAREKESKGLYEAESILATGVFTQTGGANVGFLRKVA